MMEILEHVSLRACNTLALDASARYFVRVTSEDELLQALEFARQQCVPVLMLGEGSNVVLGRDYPGFVIRNAISGINIVAADDESNTVRDRVYVEAGAGENWHRFVSSMLEQQCYGLENLALIPGTVGAAPVQNIGAYGVEASSFITGVRAFDMREQHWVTLDASACCFAYRDSIFKQQHGRYLITRVRFSLWRTPHLDIRYEALREQLERSNKFDHCSARDVFDAVVSLRQSRLPDPALLPNVGSFFKNPIVTVPDYETLHEQFPALVSYPVDSGHRKLAAAWLIDKAGWKGKGRGRVAVHERQALVLVNRGNATEADVLALAQDIADDIWQRYRVRLELEPVVI